MSENKDTHLEEDVKEKEASLDRDKSDSQEQFSEESIKDSAESLTENLKKKLEEYEDLLKRQASDFNNFRKRSQQEKEELGTFISNKVILNFLGILDNLERALDSTEQSQDFESLRSGIEGVVLQFQGVLQNYEVEGISCLGKAFDSSIHEALFKNEGDYEYPTIIQEVEKVYRRKGTTLRVGKVGVGIPKQKQEESSIEDDHQ